MKPLHRLLASRSRSRAALECSPFAPDMRVLSVCRMRCAVSGVLRVDAVSRRLQRTGVARGRPL